MKTNKNKNKNSNRVPLSIFILLICIGSLFIFTKATGIRQNFINMASIGSDTIVTNNDIIKLSNEIKFIDEDVDFSIYRGNLRSLNDEIGLFIIWGQYIKDGLKSNNKEVVNLAKELKHKVIRIQENELPKIRKEFTKISFKSLLIQDVTTYFGGKDNDKIYFIGDEFGSVSNIQKFHDKYTPILTRFRFREVHYLWYLKQKDHDYFGLIDIPKDSELF